MIASREVIDNEDPTGFVMYAEVIVGAFFIFDFIPEKEKSIDKSLIRTLGRACCIWTSSIFGLLGLYACRAAAKDRASVGSKFWNTFDKLVGIEKVIIAWVSKTLMPKETFRLCFDRGNGSIVLNILMERKGVIFLVD